MGDDKKPTETKPHKKRGNLAGVVIGFALAAFGVVWLLSRMGHVLLAPLWHYWPSILIVAGLANLLQRGQNAAHYVFCLILVGFGTTLQLHYLGWIHIQWDYIWPAAIIVVGTWIALTSVLSRGKKKKKKKGRPDLPEDVVVFGGRDERVRNEAWPGGEATAIFGGFNIDLRDAEMEGDEVEFQATAIFGGVELRVPDHWIVEVKGSPVMGAFEDKTRAPRKEPGQKPKKLVLSGVAIFGGVEVKN